MKLGGTAPTTGRWSAARFSWNAGSGTAAAAWRADNHRADLRRRESLDELVDHVGDSALVEFFELDGNLHAVTVVGTVPRGCTPWARCGPSERW